MTIKLKNCGNAFFLSSKQGKADKDCKPVGRRQKRQASKLLRQISSEEAIKILNNETYWQQEGMNQ